MDAKIIGENLKIMREKSGYNQKNIADYLNVDQSMISKIEKGERNISADMLESLSALFGVTVSTILGTTEMKYSLSCAFRCADITVSDMKTISAINKIALNSEEMYRMLEGHKNGR